MQEVRASTQYNDLVGTSAMDFHGSGTELNDFAEEIGFDTDEYIPVGLSLYFGESDSSFYPSIMGKHRENETLHTWMFEMSFEEFQRRFKRFSVSLIQRHSGINPDDEISEEGEL